MVFWILIHFLNCWYIFNLNILLPFNIISKIYSVLLNKLSSKRWRLHFCTSILHFFFCKLWYKHAKNSNEWEFKNINMLLFKHVKTTHTNVFQRKIFIHLYIKLLLRTRYSIGQLIFLNYWCIKSFPTCAPNCYK